MQSVPAQDKVLKKVVKNLDRGVNFVKALTLLIKHMPVYFLTTYKKNVDKKVI